MHRGTAGARGVPRISVWLTAAAPLLAASSAQAQCATVNNGFGLRPVGAGGGRYPTDSAVPGWIATAPTSGRFRASRCEYSVSP